jgi:gas vesicle protein
MTYYTIAVVVLAVIIFTIYKIKSIPSNKILVEKMIATKQKLDNQFNSFKGSVKDSIQYLVKVESSLYNGSVKDTKELLQTEISNIENEIDKSYVSSKTVAENVKSFALDAGNEVKNVAEDISTKVETIASDIKNVAESSLDKAESVVSTIEKDAEELVVGNNTSN